MRLLAFTALVFLLAVSQGCRRQQQDETAGVDTSQNVAAAPAPAITDTAPSTPDFTFEQRRDFAGTVRQELSDIDRQITELASQAKSLGGAVSDRALANIRASRRAVDRNLARIDAATSANWEQIKESVNRSVADLSEAIEAAQPK